MPLLVDLLFQRESVPVLDAAMSFAHQRQQVIMNNIANVETPYYKRQGLAEEQFRDALVEAIDDRREDHPMEFRLRDRRDVRFEYAGTRPVASVLPAQDFGPERHDENSVVIEKEMADLAKNTLLLETMQRLVKKKYSMLQSALRDRIA